MRKRSELSKFIYALLQRQRSPKPMRWIIVAACNQFVGSYERRKDGAFHRKVWNSVWNGCVAPKAHPRLRAIVKPEETLFEINK